MKNQNDVIAASQNKLFQMPLIWQKVMREADTYVRRRMEDTGPAYMDSDRLRRRAEKMATYPAHHPQQHLENLQRMGVGTYRSDSEVKKGYYGSTDSESAMERPRGMNPFFTQQQRSTSPRNSPQRQHPHKSRQVKTPGGWNPPGIVTPAIPEEIPGGKHVKGSPLQHPPMRYSNRSPTQQQRRQSPNCPSVHQSSASPRPFPSNYNPYAGGHFIPREIPPISPPHRTPVGEMMKEVRPIGH